MNHETFQQIAKEAARRYGVSTPCGDAFEALAATEDHLSAYYALRSAANLFRFPETEFKGRCITMAVLSLHNAKETDDYDTVARCLEPILVP